MLILFPQRLEIALLHYTGYTVIINIPRRGIWREGKNMAEEKAKAKAKKKSTFFGLEWEVVWFALVDIALILLGILNDYILHLVPFPVCLLALLFGGFRCTKDTVEATIAKKEDHCRHAGCSVSDRLYLL